MLAPRKTLWSTPIAVVPILEQWIELSDADVVCDVGCGDATVLMQWAAAAAQGNAAAAAASFLGIEMDEERAALAKHRASKFASITIHCGNALEAAALYHNVTVFFLYLIPRGLRLMLPILMDLAKKRSIRVVTYMAPLPGLEPIRQTYLEVEHQPGARWPLYLYHLGQ
jgi:precorrin-6B methylase 2